MERGEANSNPRQVRLAPSLLRAKRLSIEDVSAGRMAELDAIGGAIVRRGRRYGLVVPTTRQLIARIEDCLNKELR
jgi:ketopantoate reductase